MNNAGMDGYSYEDEEPEPWFPEFPGDTRDAFCDSYEIHAPHWYTALNRNAYRCAGVTPEERAYMEEQAEAEPCEHGLSAALCGGPMHWYD